MWCLWPPYSKIILTFLCLCPRLGFVVLNFWVSPFHRRLRLVFVIVDRYHSDNSNSKCIFTKEEIYDCIILLWSEALWSFNGIDCCHTLYSQWRQYEMVPDYQSREFDDDPDSCISLLLILLCGLVWFYAYKCYICLAISAHGIWEWLMILTLVAQLT